MPPRWITQEDWLRTGGAPEQPSHVPPERFPEIVGVRLPSDELALPQEELAWPLEEPASPQEKPPSPQEELRGAVDGTRKRFRFGTAAMTFAGLGLIMATMLYAFEVDQRALQAFKAPPRTVQPETATETVGNATASPAVSDPMPLTEQSATGQTRPGPDPMLNTQQNVRRNAHHGRTHGKRFSRGQHSEALSGDTW